MKTFLRAVLKPLSFVPAIVVLYMIFSFSEQTGAESSQVSLKVSRSIVIAADRCLDLNLDPVRAEEIAQEIHYYVRKLGHVTEYFILAVTVSFPLYVYRLRGIWLVLVAGAFCVAAAALDEYHQSFVAGRGPSIRDVCIDSIGIVIGITVVRIVCFIGRMTVFRPLSSRRKRNGEDSGPDC